ncbi:MAG: class I SAM-dependent methyltransferase [Deltaproteobacteria bacterium]|nr:class I SAM-dependent methyltransferase [Deltaproteobacteria bacterium]
MAIKSLCRSLAFLRRCYEQHFFPWFNDRLGRFAAIEELRAVELKEVRGRVLEIGFGTGLNLLHYPPAVQSLVAVEPNTGMLKRAASRLAVAPMPVDIFCGSAATVPFPKGSFDWAVSFLTLCSVDDPQRILAELRRLLGDGGRLVVVEHGLSEEPRIARWQRRLNPLEVALAGGCHLDRPVFQLVESQGFCFERVRSFYLPGAPRTHGWFTVGSARKS